MTSGDTVFVNFVYDGPLPFSSSVSFTFQDTVTEFNLCFSSEKEIPISFSKSLFLFCYLLFVCFLIFMNLLLFIYF